MAFYNSTSFLQCGRVPNDTNFLLPLCSVMWRHIFMTIQLYLSHTLVECASKFLNAVWHLLATTRCWLLSQRKLSNFAFWPSQWQHSTAQSDWLGTMSFTHTTWHGVFKFTNDNSISIGNWNIRFMRLTGLFFHVWMFLVWDSKILCENTVYALNRYAICWSNL